MKIVYRLIFLIFFFFIFPVASFAQVSQIIFTTDSQSIKPNTLSGPITIQAQDSSGNSFQTPETMDIQFISSSNTGLFLNSSGDPATAYMSKNTANRTFYYKDTSEGVFTITINMRGRESGIELDTSQTITISSGTSSDTNSPDSHPTGEVLGATSGSVNKVSNLEGGSTTNVSSLNSQLEVLAGNDRTTSPGSPIWFQATIKKNTAAAGLTLSWSFGDGNVGVGPLVSHTYKYPGDYVVVLSANADDIFSVSRLKVRVIESNILVLDKGQYLEVVNNGNTEINLFNWKVESEGRGFIFQPNTIILPHSFVRLDKSMLNMKGYDNSTGVALKNALKEEVFAMTKTNETDLKAAAGDLEVIKKEAFSIREKIPKINTKIENRATVVLKETDQIATSTENLIYELPKPESFLKRTWLFLAGLFD